MTELETKLSQILEEKQNKIIPENIKEGVQIFDIMGTLKSGGSSSGVKLFETKEEMQADETAEEGDLAVVYRNEIQNFAEDTQTQYITFPETVTLPEAFTGNVNGMLRAVDESVMFDGNIRLDQNMFRFDGLTYIGMIMVSYTSSDGITYTREEFTGDAGSLTNPVDLGTVVQYEPMEGEWNDTLGYFMQIDGSTFEGLFEYKSYTDSDTHPVKYKYFTAQNQLTSIADKVYNSIYYGKDGVNQGTLTQNVSNSFADINAEVYSKIQQVYNNMEPRVLTDDDKEIDQNIHFIPTKLDGTPLLDTSNVTDMYVMFFKCENLTSIPQLDTSNVTNMNGTFENCTNLKTIANLNTSNVTNMNSIFDGCENLISVPQFDTSSVIYMGAMFSRCQSLVEVPQFDTSKVTKMGSMFIGCTNLVTVPQFDMSSIVYSNLFHHDIQNMFSRCPSLSSDSLNNILKSLLTATSYTETKTLAYIGLSEEQATTCTTLSNWSACEAKGWTTGY